MPALASVLTRLTSRLVPARWRSSVVRDLAEEAARRQPPAGDMWMAWQCVRIALGLRRKAVAQMLPSADGLLTGFQQDVTASLRHLKRSSSLTAISVVTMALAVAAVVTVGAIAYRTVLHPLPFADAARLVAIWRFDPATPASWVNVTAADFVEWQRDTRTLESLVAGRNISMAFTGFPDGGAPLMRRVTFGWFETLGVTPALGRTFAREEDRPNGPPVAILHHATWRDRFGGRPDVVGQSVELDGISHTIVGVLPASYHNPVFGLVDHAQVYLPLGLADSGESRLINNLLAIGRLSPGTTIEDAQAEFTRLSDQQAQVHPESNRRFRATAQRLDEILVRTLRTPLALLSIAVVALLVAACGNVANLQLVRALSRRQEHAVQQALGASRVRLVLQALTETLMVSAAAGLGAVGLAAVAGPAAQRLTPPGFLAPQLSFELGPMVLALAGVVTLVAGVLTSVPALCASGRRLVGTELGAGTMRAVGSRERRRWATVLVAVEVAVAVVLLAGAGLAIAGMNTLERTSHGFDEQDAVAFRVSTRGPAYAASAARVTLFERVLDEFRGIPGVTAVGGMNALPVFDQFGERPVARGDVAERTTADASPRLVTIPITDGFFAAMGMPLRDGRDVQREDRLDGAAVAILSRAAAQRLFGTDRAVGRDVVVFEGGRERRLHVVGMVDDVRSATDPTRVTAVMYVPWLQAAAPTAFGFVVRTPDTTAAVQRQVQAAVARIDRSLPVYQLRSMEDVAAGLVAAPRFTSVLLSVFAVLGVALVASGLFGTISHLVAERRLELSMRVALGASRASLLRLVMIDGCRPAVIGLAVGWVGALGFGQVIARAVAGTPAFQWPLFLMLPAVLFALCTLASLTPAIRAMRVDPTIVLRR